MKPKPASSVDVLPFWQRTYGSLTIILLLTGICLAPALFNGWVNWDDYGYVLRNPLVQHLSLKQVGVIFSTPEVVGAYYPFTVLSFAIDYALAGEHPFLFHFTSYWLHLLNTALVFLFLRKLSGFTLAAAIAALLFGIHPMHLESVAWISARKDVLYGCFYLLGLIVYLDLQQENKSAWRFYIVCLFLFICALLSKPMAVTFPIMLLLIDYLKQRQDWGKAMLEKIPFFLLSIMTGIWGITTQQTSSATLALDAYPFYQTIFLGSQNLLIYLVKAIVPYHLSPFHPYTFTNIQSLPWYFYASVLPLLLGAWALWLWGRHNRHVLFGLGMFLVSIALGLQIIPVGKSIIAERFTYLAYIGLFYLFGYGFEYVSRHDKKVFVKHRWIPQTTLIAYVIILMGITFNRIPVWKNGETLWSDVIEKYPEHYFAYSNRGDYWYHQKDLYRAEKDLNHSIELYPNYAEAYYYRGKVHEKLKHPDKAFADFNKAIQLDSTHDRSYLSRGLLNMSIHKNPTAAIKDMDRAISLNHQYALAYLNRGVLHESLKHFDKALVDYEKAVSIQPRNALYLRYLGWIKYLRGDYPAAITGLGKSIQLDPDDAEAWFLRSQAFLANGDHQAAKQDALKAKSMGYNLPEDYFDGLLN